MSKDPYALPSGSFPISGTRTRGWNDECVEDVSGELEWRALTAGREDGRCTVSVKATMKGSEHNISAGIGLDRDAVERLLASDRAVQEFALKELSDRYEEYDLKLQ